MRAINIYDDVQQIILNYVKAIPDFYLDFPDNQTLELVFTEQDEDASYFDLVIVEGDETELVVGEVSISDDFTVYIDIFED